MVPSTTRGYGCKHYLEPSAIFLIGPADKVALAIPEPFSVEEVCGVTCVPLLVSSVKEICELRKAATNSAALTEGPTRHWQSLGELLQKPVRFNYSRQHIQVV